MKSKQHFYDLEAVNLNGDSVPMRNYKGKVVLVVNTASKCGLTPQYSGLEKIYDQYKDKGFVILGFPCNQFANQEPGDEELIKNTCYINYGVTFPMFSKIEVNGPGTHPIFELLKQSKRSLFGKKIAWNFTKFLLDAEGRPVKRFSPLTPPERITIRIEKLIARK